MILMAQNQKGQGTKWGARGGPKKYMFFYTHHRGRTVRGSPDKSGSS